MFWNRPLLIVLLVALLALSWWRLQPQGGEVRRTQLMMGTVVEILAAGQDTGRLNQAVDAAFAEIDRLDKLLSSHRDDSEVSHLSRSSTGMQVSVETAEVIRLGLDVAQRSAGAFDMTLGQLKSLWGIDSEAPQIPGQERITAALAATGPASLSLHNRLVTKQAAQLQVDLGGIAKGYAVDRAIAVLKQHGVLHAAINAGGDMYLLGQRKERPWRIGIKHPREANAIIETVEVSNRSVVTSGDYERFFEQDGQRYHHIFDPINGFPARLCQSVTIITDSVALGDALATAVFVLGPQKGLQLLEDYPHSEGLVIAIDGSRHASRDWASYQVKR